MLQSIFHCLARVQRFFMLYWHSFSLSLSFLCCFWGTTILWNFFLWGKSGKKIRTIFSIILELREKKFTIFFGSIYFELFLFSFSICKLFIAALDKSWNQQQRYPNGFEAGIFSSPDRPDSWAKFCSRSS